MGSISHFILHLLAVSGLELLTLLGGLLFIGFSLGGVERLANQNLWRTFGKKGILVTASLGTPIHELSHLIMCFVFHHKVDKVKLIQFKADDGTLGYVSHRYNLNSLYQKMGNFFIGVAPILGGLFTIWVLMAFFTPTSYKTCVTIIQKTVESDKNSVWLFPFHAQVFFLLFKSIFNWSNLVNPAFWIFVLLAISIASHVSLSREDIRGAASGIASLFSLLVILNLGLTIFRIQALNIETLFLIGNLYLFSAASLLFFFSFLHLIISYILRGLFRRSFLNNSFYHGR